MSRLLLSLLMLALVAPASLGQSADKPTVAILRFGSFFSFTYVENAIIDTLNAAGLFSEAEYAIAQAGENLEGERISLYFADANFDFAAANLIVEQALDRGAEALITLSTPTAQAAVNITADMDDPPAVLFTSVYNPYEAGIAQAPCLKPAHVTGIESLTPYEDILPLLLLQDPDLSAIGVIYSSSETSGRLGAERITQVAEAQGLRVETVAASSIPDLPVAAESLIEKGVDAFLIPADLLTISGLPAIMQVAIENGLPVFHSTANTINMGATVSAGSSENTLQGNLIGAILLGHLSGELDIARTGIGLIDNLNVGVNLDVAEMQGIEIEPALYERADLLLRDGSMTGRRLIEFLEGIGMDDEMIGIVVEAAAQAQSGGGAIEADLPKDVADMLAAAIAAFASSDDVSAIVDGLHCADETIAEQRAALDAAKP